MEEIPRIATVEVLARVWPSRRDEGKVILAALTEDKVFADPVTALAYLLDVLVWHDEIAIRSRPRAAFLRLYGAVESTFFYLFEAHAGRHTESLKVTPIDPGALEELAARYPVDRHGECIDWPGELRRAVLGFFRINSLGALRVLARSSAQLEPQVDLGKLLGERAREARRWIPKVVVSLEEPPLRRGLYQRLISSKKGGLGRFNQVRNKAAHWMAPVPMELALELSQYYRRVLCELIPTVTEPLQQDVDLPESERLNRWTNRLLEAARGEASAGDRPVSFRQALGLLKSRRNLERP